MESHLCLIFLKKNGNIFIILNNKNNLLLENLKIGIIAEKAPKLLKY